MLRRTTFLAALLCAAVTFLAASPRAALADVAPKLEAEGPLKAIGQKQGIGVDPPFDLGPANPSHDPRYPSGPVVEIPPQPRPATRRELKKHLPPEAVADKEFFEAQLDEEATLEEATAAWELLRRRKFPPTETFETIHYVGMAAGVLCILFGIALLFGVPLLICGVVFYRRRASQQSIAAKVTETSAQPKTLP